MDYLFNPDPNALAGQSGLTQVGDPGVQQPSDTTFQLLQKLLEDRVRRNGTQSVFFVSETWFLCWWLCALNWPVH
jgi:hypothetical protein